MSSRGSKRTADWFSTDNARKLDRLTRDWWQHGWSALDISPGYMRWQKGNRVIEIYPNNHYTDYGPIEVYVDGYPWKDRFYETPEDALDALDLQVREDNPLKRRSKNPKTAVEAMSWHHDPLVRDIASELDDRELDEIAESIIVAWLGSEEEYEGEGEPGWVDPARSFEEPHATDHLTREEAVEAAILAADIADWANFGTAYGDYSDPPWERFENPEPAERVDHYHAYAHSIEDNETYWLSSHASRAEAIVDAKDELRNEDVSRAWVEGDGWGEVVWESGSVSRRRNKGKACALPGEQPTRERDRLPDKAFGLPKERKYPMYRLTGGKLIPSGSHAANAKARAQQEYDDGRITKAQLKKIDRKADRILKSCGGRGGKRKKNPGTSAPDGRRLQVR